MRRAAKRDDNEPLIVTALQSAGWTVVRVSDTGVPDLLCAKAGRLVLLEVKSEDGTLTEAQKETFERLAGAGVAVPVVRSPDEALTVLGCPYASFRWLAVNGAFICEHCWVPEDGLHAKDCPTRKALAKPPKVQSAYRAAKTLEEALPKARCEMGPCKRERMGHSPFCVIHSNPIDFPPGGVNRPVTTEQVKAALEEMRPPRGVEGELQPLAKMPVRKIPLRNRGGMD